MVTLYPSGRVFGKEAALFTQPHKHRKEEYVTKFNAEAGESHCWWV
jgi:hypothetical protein